MLLRFSITAMLALVMLIPTRGDPLSAHQLTAALATTHSFDEGEDGDKDRDRHDPNNRRDPGVPEPSPLVPLALLLAGTALIRKRVDR